MRPSARERNQLREIKFTRNYTKHAEGSVLVEYGDTKVLCNASVTQGVPKFLKGQNQGWVTAEYGMIPRSTNERMQREAQRGQQSGRTQEIQRLIGRALRASVELKNLPEYTITVDCDVIQADGGTRTASISGGCIALYDAINYLVKRQIARKDPKKCLVASVSVGIYKGLPILDLDYTEDVNAHTDMNVVMTDKSEFIEVQGTAEMEPFKLTALQDMLELATGGIRSIIEKQKEALGIK